MQAIINTKVITENGMIWDGVILFEQGTIVAVDWADRVTIPEHTKIIDAQGLYAAPGFIDIHCHGGPDGAWDMNPDAAARHHLTHGTTTILPAIGYSRTLEEMLEGKARIQEASRSGAARIVKGLYMEGPYMSTRSSGQKYVKWTGPIIPEEYVPLVQGMKGYARVWAIDPAREGVEPFMAYLRQEDPEAIFAHGHSKATFDQCRKLRKYGVKVQTHFNDSGQAPGRAQGTAGAGCDHYTLHEPDVYAELICDSVGVHVDADLIKTLIRTKGVERVILITDYCTRKTDFKNNEEEGILYGPDLNYDYQGHLNGSCLTMDSAVRNLMKHTAYGLCHAVRMGSLNAARMLGIDDAVGSLEPGKQANILLMDDMVNIHCVYFDGELVVENGEYRF